MRIFDAHFHIIDFDFPIIENQGYLPPSYIVENYQNHVHKCSQMVFQIIFFY